MKVKPTLLIALLMLLLPTHHAQAQSADFWEGMETFDGPTDENPILAAQIDFYLDRLVSPLPDSITAEIDRLVAKTGSNTELRDFILWHLLERYHHPDYMTQDQVFVWLYDRYFAQAEIKDLDETNREFIREKANRLRRLALFKPAPDFRCESFDGLQSVESPYTVLFFYDHDCDLCQHERNDIDSVCLARPDIALVAIDLNTTDTKVDTLYELYDIEATPLIYVLDRDKNIIAKKIRARQLNQVVE